MNHFRDISYGVMLMVLALMYYPAGDITVLGFVPPPIIVLVALAAMIHFIISGLAGVLSHPAWALQQWVCKRWIKSCYVSEPDRNNGA